MAMPSCSFVPQQTVDTLDVVAPLTSHCTSFTTPTSRNTMKIQNILLALSLLASTDAFFVPNTVAFANKRMISSSSLFASTLERLPDSAVQIGITAPGSATKAAYDKVCTELSKNITIPGFRKGSKIPAQVLEQNMSAKGGRNALKIQAINELLGQLIAPALKEEHGLEPVGQPSLTISAEELAKDFTPGEDLSFTVKCDVWPDIEWKTIEGKEKPYFGLSGSYKRKPFNQVKLNKALSDLMERYVELQPIEDTDHVLQMGDACVVNMEGFMANEDGTKGEPLPNAASGDRVEVILGPGRYMTGLVEGLEGGKVGETKLVTVTFPVALRDKTLAGKKAVFDVTIVEASKRTLPDLTDEFANKVRAGLTVENLKEELRKAVDNEDAKEFTPARNAVLASSLSAVLDVEVPDSLVTNQAREKFALMMTDMRNNGVSDEEVKKQIQPENFLKYKKIVRADIVRDFKVSMATDEIARMENIEVPDYQVEEQMEAIRKDAAESNEQFDETLIRGKVEATLQRSAVMDFLAENGDLKVEYTDDGEKFDEALLEKIAEESIKREEEFSASEQGESTATPTPVVDAVVEEPKEEPVVAKAEPTPEPKKDAAPEERDYSSMTLEEKAYYALKDSGALDDSADA